MYQSLVFQQHKQKKYVPQPTVPLVEAVDHVISASTFVAQSLPIYSFEYNHRNHEFVHLWSPIPRLDQLHDPYGTATDALILSRKIPSPEKLTDQRICRVNYPPTGRSHGAAVPTMLHAQHAADMTRPDHATDSRNRRVEKSQCNGRQARTWPSVTTFAPPSRASANQWESKRPLVTVDC